MKRFIIDDYQWDKVERNKNFIRNVYSPTYALDRPGCILHPKTAPASAAEPAGLGEFEKQVWRFTEGIRARSPEHDDFVPTISTAEGTCAMATAFGCKESEKNGLFWVDPSIASPSEIDSLKKPKITDGKLGRVLEKTKAFAKFADERIPIRIMDFQSPFTTVEQMLGSELFFLMPYDEPERLKHLMDIVTDYCIDFFSAQIKAAGPNCCPGCWPAFWFPKEVGIQMSDDNMVNVSPEVYDEFVLPYNNRISEAFGGLFLHSCTIKEQNLESIRKIKGLKGVNCDISTSVSPGRLMEFFGDNVVVAPHAYINTDTNFKSYTDFMNYVLKGWNPGKRLFIYPCTVLYMKESGKEITFNDPEVRQILNKIPGWKKAFGN